MLQKVKARSPKLKDAKLFRTQCYVDGAWIDAEDKSTITVVNPADGSVIGTVPRMGEAETRRAAMFWIAQSDDPRVLAFFEEILLGR